MTTGSTNEEAEARAKAKGLFQSMDEVGKTAISWTLGKVVIEASRSVAQSASPQGINWRAHTTQVSPVILFCYAIVAGLILYFLFTLLRRRRCLRRKRGASYSALSSYFASSSSADEEEGDTYSPPAKRRPTKLKLWSRRVTNALRRNVSLGHMGLERPRGQRHASMPLSTPTAMSQSQPPSPRGNGRSFSMMDLPGALPNTPPLGSSSSVASSTPRPPRVRQNSGNGLLDPHYSGLSREQGGWNDPPIAMFARSRVSTDGHATPAQGYESGAEEEWPAKKRNGVLTPSAGLSRNSSRANLSELGLAQRSSRATPGEGH